MSEKTFKIVDGDISDGSHTFTELYRHRCMLYIALCMTQPQNCAWKYHYEGWFCLYLETPKGQVSYHCPDDLLHLILDHITYKSDYDWDGHTSDDVLGKVATMTNNPQAAPRVIEDIRRAHKYRNQFAFDRVSHGRIEEAMDKLAGVDIIGQERDRLASELADMTAKRDTILDQFNCTDCYCDGLLKQIDELKVELAELRSWAEKDSLGLTRRMLELFETRRESDQRAEEMKAKLADKACIETNFREVQADRARLESQLAVAVEGLEKVADPRKRDHREPDAYTQLGCVMHMADECLQKLKGAK